MLKNKLLSVFISFVVLLVLFAVGLYVLSINGENTADSSVETGVNNYAYLDDLSIDERIRLILRVDSSEELVSQVNINTEDALNELKSTTPLAIVENAMVGDYYVVYSQKAILYRPEDNQIINYISIQR